MEQQLAYSFHLGSDKNKSKLAKKVSKGNVSGTTSLSNNAIQNANALSKVNKHNLRDYDNEKDLIRVIRGTNDIVNDVKDLYLEEFEEARIEYNNKQTRNDRKINNYFMKINESQNDLACEIIIELGDMDFWKDKDKQYRLKMIDVYNEQVNDLVKILPTFKIANATIHFDETSPHMHIVGVPIIENCTRGMKKQVGKSQLFTKESLTKIQDKMRTACIKSFNKFYDIDFKLKEKQKGRNQDINVNEMGNYKKIKKQLEQKEQKLEKANIQTKKLDNSSNDINEILDNLKPTIMNKNNMVISSEDVQKIKKFTKDVKDINKTVRSVNDLNMAINDFEHSVFEIEKENRSLKYQIEEKDKEIYNLKGELSAKDKIIGKLREEKESIKAQLHKFKEFWHSIMGHFHKRICYDKDNNYQIVSDDLYKNGIFTDDENEIANNIARKVKPKDEINNAKNNRKKNDTRF
ncbi:MAG TPA: plasmid recombination protein [Clostridiaceae bacterium]|nr:plasmid recombination protein [Clostridiaceae bacterium]